MDRKLSLRWALAAALFCFAAGVAQAQSPTAGAVAAARELIQTKGGGAMFEPVIPGVVESTRNSLLPTNPNLTRELNDVAAQLASVELDHVGRSIRGLPGGGGVRP